MPCWPLCREMRVAEDALHMKKRLTTEEAGEISETAGTVQGAEKGEGEPQAGLIRTRYYHLVQKLRDRGKIRVAQLCRLPEKEPQLRRHLFVPQVDDA